MGRWSIAWRIHDAQFWGVPQRRKRIALVADFNGLSAAEIMFDPQYWRETEDSESYETESDSGRESRQQIQSFSKSMSGDTEPSRETGENTSETVRSSIEKTGSISGTTCLNPWDIQCKHIQTPDGIAEALYSGESSYTGGEQYILDNKSKIRSVYGVVVKGNGDAFISEEKHTSLTIGGGEPGQGYPCILDTSVLDNKSKTYCIEGNGQRDSHKGDGYSESDVMYTLNTVEQHAVACVKEPITIEMTSTKNTIGQNGIMPTLTARMGTGGNQVNAVLTEKNNYQETVETLCACDYKGISNTYVEQAKVILQKVPANAVLMDSYQHYGYKENETTGTLTADQNMHVRGDTPLVIDEVDVARRLTPLECERLQNFPDGWTDIGEWEDDDGKLHKYSDTPRYKALGNAIALPFWEWLARQISAQYETPCTMGGLFSGIGGFELAFARCGIKPQFTCEIEQFPRAVLRKHFGDNKTGQEGEYYKYL